MAPHELRLRFAGRPLLRRGDGNGLGRAPVQLAQPRHDLTAEQRDIGHRVGMVEKPALPEHLEVAEAADAVAERLYLIVDIVRGAGEAGAALDQLLDRRSRLLDRVAVAVADKTATLAA